MLLILKLKSLNIPEHLVHTKIPRKVRTRSAAPAFEGSSVNLIQCDSTRESPPSERKARQERADSGVIDSMAHEVARVRRIARARDVVRENTRASGRHVSKEPSHARTNEPGPTHEKHDLFPASRASAVNAFSFLSCMLTSTRARLSPARTTVWVH